MMLTSRLQMALYAVCCFLLENNGSGFMLNWLSTPFWALYLQTISYVSALPRARCFNCSLL